MNRISFNHIWKMDVISPLRQIVLELSAKNMNYISKNSRVLEIGCGFKEDIKRLVEAKGCKWYGIDVRRESIASDIGSVRNIPFESDSFDAVIASQSIEHWYEYMATFEDGLFETYRILRDNGILLIDYPIYLHGHPIFMLGRKEKIYDLFDKRLWNLELIKSHYPESPYYTWSGKRNKVADQFVMELILKFKRKSSYVEQIVARKIHSDVKRNITLKKLNNFCKNSMFFLLSIIREVHERAILFSTKDKKI